MAKTIFGLLGYPVKHSLSAFMHNAAFAACGMDAEYRLFEIKPVELSRFLLEDKALFFDTMGREIFAADVAGFNITVPHKVSAKNILEERFSSCQDEEQSCVKLAGAINTVKRQVKGLQYRNTDVPGFLRSLKDDLRFDPEDKTILLLGCGGAGRAVIAGLLAPESSVRRIYILEKDEMTVRVVMEHFHGLENKLVFIGRDNLESAAQDAQLLVNSTPVGMHDNDPVLVDKALLHKNLNIYDVIYNRPTPLLLDAQRMGIPSCNGLGMLLYQGVIAWEFWTGKTAPVDVMRKALRAALSGGSK